MKHFTCLSDVSDPVQLISEAIALKQSNYSFPAGSKRLTLGLVFMNPSLRTRMSTLKAAQLLGVDVLVANSGSDGWALECGDLPMNGTTVEHIHEAAAVMGEYCDIVGVRCFPGLTDKAADEQERVLNAWRTYCKKPVLSLESALRHPLQSLADMMTITEHSKKPWPKVVLTWAPHIRAVPHAVANSFAEWMQCMRAEFVIACPEEAMLNPEFTRSATITHNQEKALEGADFVYVKSWASYEAYGKLIAGKENWMLNEAKLQHTNNAKLMHCLPVRRDVEVAAELLESDRSLVIAQAGNRVWAAQAVLKQLAETNYGEITKTMLQHDHSY